jgi:hypothetical protein
VTLDQLHTCHVLGRQPVSDAGSEIAAMSAEVEQRAAVTRRKRVEDRLPVCLLGGVEDPAQVAHLAAILPRLR